MFKMYYSHIRIQRNETHVMFILRIQRFFCYYFTFRYTINVLPGGENQLVSFILFSTHWFKLVWFIINIYGLNKFVFGKVH